ncbi:hypothetical protein [Candidatus Hodarchaeum mangrovi]
MSPIKKCTICGEEFYASYKGKYYCVVHLEMKLNKIKKEEVNEKKKK